MKRFLLIFIVLLSLVPAAIATPEKPTLGFTDGDYPLVNEPTRIMISHASANLSDFTLEVKYRPNSSTSYTETLEGVSEDGYINWTPKTAGIATLKAVSGDITIEKSVSIRFGSFPIQGILIFALAALILFGGLIALILMNTGSEQTA